MKKAVVHTDLLVGHLTAREHPSLLRCAMEEMLCYVTVFHAMELFAMAGSRPARQAAEEMLSAMKILGLNARSAQRLGSLRARHRDRDMLHVLVAGMCIESRLPLLTDRTREFAPFRGLTVLNASRTLRRAVPAST